MVKYLQPSGKTAVKTADGVKVGGVAVKTRGMSKGEQNKIKAAKIAKFKANRVA